ncbi:hypothetical protein CKAN_01825100 [Cinnamomum micranthum f. kanehirae]|uniref:DUF1685 domain-containing protein n=1 Tax=Cinnamomum micranthum f. kanehirae TaxID=337451 RepID=A0A443PEK6_9MAGN|nr:hypothetical protein CKAN_01825100 [Cinnamomum micranthum f. kanehirae]
MHCFQFQFPREEEQVTTMFEVFWFYHNIFSKSPSVLPPTNQTPIQEKTQIEKPTISRLQSLRQQSLSSESSYESGSFSPNSVLPVNKLDKILFGKEVEEVTVKIMKQEAEKKVKKERVGRRKKWGTKSLSDLELEEVQGFLDLGFTFSDDHEIDSRLSSIVPGLRRLGKNAAAVVDEEEVDESAVSRPYLSEAWTVNRREENPLTNWRIPATSNAADIKKHLKIWAQAVASTVVRRAGGNTLRSILVQPQHLPHRPASFLPPTKQITIQDNTQIEKPTISRLLISFRQQSLSSELSSESDSFSPSSVLPLNKLDQILSGKEAEVVAEKVMKQETEKTMKKEMVCRGKIWGTKSLSDLELEELKGFMDLGFTFSDIETDSRLISVVPGLRRSAGKKEREEEEVDESAVSRPYLSESWTVDRREENPLTNWRVPVGSNAADMKNHLRLWAHTVALTVRS